MQSFLDIFTELLVDILTCNTNLVVLGDFNIHVNETSNPNVNIFLDTMTALGLKQHVDGPTHKGGNCLDLIFTEELSRAKAVGCSKDMFVSDHSSIICILDIPKENCTRKEITFRKLRDVDRIQLVKDMSLEEIKTDKLDDMVEQLERSLAAAIDKQAPEITKVITDRKKKPWFGDKLKEQKRIVRRREKIYRRYRLESCWTAFDMERRKYRRMLVEAKNVCYSNQVKEYKGDTKRLYRMVNTLMGTSSSNPLPSHANNLDLAEDFADFFMGKIENIRENLAENQLYRPTGKMTPSLAEFRSFNLTEVRKIITDMKTKTCELDVLPTKLLKDCLEDILPTITDLVNISLSDGVFASKWKTSVIRPLLKKPNLDLILSSYRPVSNLPFLSKLLEKCAMDRVNEHCKKHDLVPDYQSAYRNGYSCETAIVKLVNDLLWAMESQNITAIMALDLSAAFDTVDHRILLNVLEKNFGLKGTVLNWFNSYLDQRSCKVNIGEEYSSTRELAFSVPQGSCAGAQLFNMYCSTMQEVVNPPLTLHGFADDHVVCNKFKPGEWNEEERCIGKLEECATTLKVWMNENRLKMNSDKTEFVLFGSRSQLEKCKIKALNVDDTEVEMMDGMKYLGVILDQNLNMKKHITTKCQTAMLNIQRIKNIRHLLTQDATETLVLGTVISHLDYCNSILANLPETDIAKMQRIQNIAGRMVVLNDVAMKDDSSRSILEKLHWLPIRRRIQYKVLTLVHKCLVCRVPRYLAELLVEYPYAERRQGLRSQNLEKRLVEPRVKFKTFAARSFGYVGPRWWNMLPNALKNINSTDEFRSKLKTYLFKEEYMS